MLTYEPDDTLAHGLDPRSKLALQLGFAAAALSYTGPRALLALGAFAIVVLVSARVALLKTLYAFRFPLVLLAAAPAISMLTVGSPWLEPTAAVGPARASFRVALVLLVGAAYVRSTPIRDSRAAIQRTIPGKSGRLLGTGVGLVFRFLPVLGADVRTIREASAARLGTERGPVDRLGRLGILGLTRAFDRADRLSMAMQARCFSWNPTLPHLQLSWLDVPVLGLAVVLVVAAMRY